MDRTVVLAITILVSTCFHQMYTAQEEIPSEGLNTDMECECPTGWTYHGCMCYYMDYKPLLTWETAESTCKSLHRGAHLLSVVNKEEMAEIKRDLQTTRPEFDHQGRFVSIFIGIRLKRDNDRMQWTDGNSVVFSEWYHPAFTDWVPDNRTYIKLKDHPQPINTRESKCGMMIVDRNHNLEWTNWFLIPCDVEVKQTGFICKVPAAEVQEQQRTPHLKPHLEMADSEIDADYQLGKAEVNLCPSGWTLFSGKCVKMIKIATADTEMPDYDLEVSCSRFDADTSSADEVLELLKIWKRSDEDGRIFVREGDGYELLYPIVDEHMYSLVTKMQDYFIRKVIFDSNKNSYGSSLDNLTYGFQSIPGVFSVVCKRLPVTMTAVPSCEELEFRCSDGTCISNAFICDGKSDCNDGSDEVANLCKVEHFPKFVCENRGQIPYSNYCDFVSHCSDSSDEQDCVQSPCTTDEFRCTNGQCIAISKMCDLFPHCLDGSDEAGVTCLCHYKPEITNITSQIKIESEFQGRGNCDAIEKTDLNGLIMGTLEYSFQYLRQNETKAQIFKSIGFFTEPHCSDPNSQRCLPTLNQCYPQHKACIYDRDALGGLAFCSDGSHLQNCADVECQGLFKCRHSYCIPTRFVCDGNWDCPYGEEEKYCPIIRSCPGRFRCRGSNICLDRSDVCDGVPHCPEGDDEAVCSQSRCPFGCSCRGTTVLCSNVDLEDFAQFDKQTRLLNITGSKLRLSNSTLFGFSVLGWLSLSRNELADLPVGLFRGLQNLIRLDLSMNKLASIRPATFQGLQRLQTLSLSGNKISRIADDTFRGQAQLTFLSLRENAMQVVEPRAFLGLRKLDVLELDGNQFALLQPESFETLAIEWLITDEHRFCCSANLSGPPVKNCFPQADEFSSCGDLLSKIPLRIIVWTLGLSAFIGNGFVIIWRILRMSAYKNENVLVINLGISDLLMGLYLMIVGSADIYFRGIYGIHDTLWRHHTVCSIGGVLSFLSCEMSIFVLVFITHSRVAAIVFPFQTRRYSNRAMWGIVGTAWLVGIGLALLPVRHFGIIDSFYNQNSICQPLTFGKRRNTYEEIFLCINLAAVFSIIIGYLLIYRTMRKSSHNMQNFSRHGCNTKLVELAFLRKMTLVIFTDLLCWVPLIIVKFLERINVVVSPEITVWLALFVLPLNSAINPYLYTVGVVQGLRKARGKWYQSSSYRRASGSLLTSKTGTRDSSGSAGLNMKRDTA